MSAPSLTEQSRLLPLRGILKSLDQGWSPKCLETSSEDPQTWSVIKTTAIQAIDFEPHENKVLPSNLLPRPELQIASGDILVTRAGPRSRVGITCLVTACRPRLMLCDKAYRLRVREDIADPKYVGLMLNAPPLLAAIEELKSGISDSGLNLTQDRFLALQLPIPPLAEQRRIVERIEALFARTRRARTDLLRIAPLAQKLREAMLGESYDFERADRIALLGDIVVDGPQNGYSPPTHPEAKGSLALKLTATTSGFLDLSEHAVKRLVEVVPPQSRFWLQPGDLLVQRANALEHLGASAIYQGPARTYVYPDLMMRLRLPSERLTRYVWRYLNSPRARQHFRQNATGTAGNMPKINGAVVRSLPIPMRIDHEVDLINKKLDALDRTDRVLRHEATRALALLDHLEQSILARAFRGDLVPQDPTDEPAAVTLSRLAAISTPRRRRASGT